MEIVLNGKQETVSKNTRMIDILKFKKLPSETVIVEVNGVILQKKDFSSFAVNENDRIEILRFVGGG